MINFKIDIDKLECMDRNENDMFIRGSFIYDRKYLIYLSFSKSNKLIYDFSISGYDFISEKIVRNIFYYNNEDISAKLNIYGTHPFNIENSEEVYTYIKSINYLEYNKIFNKNITDVPLNEIYIKRMMSIIRQDKIEKILEDI
jgi:hypothetical protein